MKSSESAYLINRAVWNISSSCAARLVGSVGGGSVHVFFSLILRIFSATYFQGQSEISKKNSYNVKHSRYGYEKGLRAGRSLQAEEIRAVLLRTYQDTIDPDQRPYPGLSPVSADLMGDVVNLEKNGVKWKTVPMPYKGLRSRYELVLFLYQS